jgi:hypothetical protein
MKLKIEKDKLKILNAVYDHIKEYLSYADINPDIESDVSEIFIQIKDKQKIKKLKNINKEIEKWIKNWEEDSYNYR